MWLPLAHFDHSRSMYAILFLAALCVVCSALSGEDSDPSCSRLATEDNWRQVCADNEGFRNRCQCTCDDTCRSMQNCCKAEGVPSSCLGMCMYRKTFISEHICQSSQCGNYLNEMRFCANGGYSRPVEQCCKSKGVPCGCLAICRGDFSTDTEQSLRTSFMCINYLNDILSCKKEVIERGGRKDSVLRRRPVTEKLSPQAKSQARALCKAMGTEKLRHIDEEVLSLAGDLEKLQTC